MRFLIFFILIILFNKNIFSNEIQIIEETIGNGNEVVNHSKVTVHYIGKLEDKTEFDNSYKRGNTLGFKLEQEK